jgi:hypothetical protein
VAGFDGFFPRALNLVHSTATTMVATAMTAAIHQLMRRENL